METTTRAGCAPCTTVCTCRGPIIFFVSLKRFISRVGGKDDDDEAADDEDMIRRRRRNKHVRMDEVPTAEEV